MVWVLALLSGYMRTVVTSAVQGLVKGYSWLRANGFLAMMDRWGLRWVEVTELVALTEVAQRPP